MPFRIWISGFMIKEQRFGAQDLTRKTGKRAPAFFGLNLPALVPNSRSTEKLPAAAVPPIASVEVAAAIVPPSAQSRLARCAPRPTA